MARANVAQVYYHNKVTGGSTWSKPEGFDGNVAAAPVPIAANKVKGTDWSEVTCSDSRKYYFNPETQVSPSHFTSRTSLTLGTSCLQSSAACDRHHAAELGLKVTCVIALVVSSSPGHDRALMLSSWHFMSMQNAEA